MKYTGRWRHELKLTFRVWPRDARAMKLALAGEEWSGDGMTYNRNEHLEVVHRIGLKGFAPFELSDADAMTLAAVGDAGAKLGEMMIRCPGSLDVKAKKECWLDVKVVVYPKAKWRNPGDGFIGRHIAGETPEAALAAKGVSYGKVIFVDRPAQIDVAGFARQMVAEDAVLVLDASRITGALAKRVRGQLSYAVFPDRKPDEEGGLYLGYQLADRVFRWQRRVPAERREEAKAGRLDRMHRATREKGIASRRAYYIGNVVRRIAEKYGVSEQRVMSRFVEEGILDWLLRSVDKVKPVLMRETASLLRGKVSDAVRSIDFYIRGLGDGEV